MYVALGSNLEDSHAHLDAAIAYLDSHEAMHSVRESPRYITDPMGPQDQPDFLNSVCSFQTTLEAHELLDVLQTLEIERGRVRPTDEAAIAALRWHARTLDCDVLLFGQTEIKSERLTVPHIGIAERAFVLQPLCDLSPQLQIPGLGPVANLLSAVDSSGIRPARG